MSMKPSRMHRDETAQGVVEFAIIGMALLLFFAGIVDFSRFMYYKSALTNAARVAAQIAGEPCATQKLCGRTKINTNDYIQQAAICEAKPYMSIESNMTSVSGFSCNTCITGPCISPCGSSACPASAGPCIRDVCVLRCPTSFSSDSDCSSTRALARGQPVIVDVGYQFQAITPVIRRFFPTIACWPGDTTPHTLCGRSLMRVFP